MSITIKSKSELAIMREAGRITHDAIWYAGERLKPGMTTLDVDKLVGEYYARHSCNFFYSGIVKTFFSKQLDCCFKNPSFCFVHYLLHFILYKTLSFFFILDIFNKICNCC